MSEIKIGDTVDCNGNIHSHTPCNDGMVYSISRYDGHLRIDGIWSGTYKAEWVRPDQITRHVPAAPVVEQPAYVGPHCWPSPEHYVNKAPQICPEPYKSVGDKLASEMTFREETIKAIMAGFAAAPDAGGTIDSAAEYAIKWADALVAALDKERAK